MIIPRLRLNIHPLDRQIAHPHYILKYHAARTRATPILQSIGVARALHGCGGDVRIVFYGVVRLGGVGEERRAHGEAWGAAVAEEEEFLGWGAD